MSEQLEGDIQAFKDTSLLVERENLEWRITKNVVILFMCKLEEIPCTVILQLDKDLEEWGHPGV